MSLVCVQVGGLGSVGRVWGYRSRYQVLGLRATGPWKAQVPGRDALCVQVYAGRGDAHGEGTAAPHRGGWEGTLLITWECVCVSGRVKGAGGCQGQTLPCPRQPGSPRRLPPALLKVPLTSPLPSRKSSLQSSKSPQTHQPGRLCYRKDFLQPHIRLGYMRSSPSPW